MTTKMNKVDTNSLRREYDFMGLTINDKDLIALKVVITICAVGLVVRFGYVAFIGVVSFWVLYLFLTQYSQEVSSEGQLKRFRDDNNLVDIPTENQVVPPIFVGIGAKKTDIRAVFSRSLSNKFKLMLISADI